MQLDFIVFIGRFAPFHNGHHAVLTRALELAREVIVLVGSANEPRTLRNPWSATEREQMIRATFGADEARLAVRPLRDHRYNETRWIGEVQAVVDAITAKTPHAKIGLIGAAQPHASSFPQWSSIAAPEIAGISSDTLREQWLAGDAAKDELVRAAVPAPVFARLQSLRATADHEQVRREYEYIQSYRQRWSVAPYEPNFVTVDAVLFHSGHVLLVRRGKAPGQGLWAFPGGFLDPHERLQTAVLRELREETGLELANSISTTALLKEVAVFDDPHRSLRGRTVTHAFNFEFTRGELPAVTGSDDAEHAQWLPISTATAMQDQFFEDHYHILEYFLGRA